MYFLRNMKEQCLKFFKPTLNTVYRPALLGLEEFEKKLITSANIQKGELSLGSSSIKQQRRNTRLDFYQGQQQNFFTEVANQHKYYLYFRNTDISSQ